MAAEVVGTAFVRVRALTKQLSDDIKDGVNKGIKDAKVNDEGREAGDDFADGFNESSSDGIQAGLKDTFEDDDNDRVAEEGGERSGEKWSDGFRDRMRASMGDTFRTVFRRDRDRDRDIELGGEDDGRTYADGFKDGIGDDDRSGIFSGLLRGLRSGARGLRGLVTEMLEFDGGGDGGDRGGESLGRRFAGGFKRGFAGALAGFANVIGSLLFNPVVLIGGLVAAIGPMLINSVIGIASQLGTVLNAAIGGALAVGAGLGTGLLALIPLIAAFTAETPLLELFKEEMAAIKEEFMVTAEIVQEQVLPGVILLAETIVDTLLPAIDDFALAVGDAFGDFMEQLSDLIASEDMVSSITSILEDSAEGFRGFLEAMVPFTELVIRVFEGLAPLASDFAEDLEVMFTRWRDFVRDRGAENLTNTFRRFYDTFKLVGGGLADLTVALYNVLSIGDSATGQGFFERFREWAREFREFTTSPEGVAKIEEIFVRAKPVLSETWGLITDITKLLFEGATSEGATSGTVGALRWLRQDAIPWLTETMPEKLGAAFDTISGAVGPVVEAVKPFAEAMGEAFSPVVQEVIDYFGEKGNTILETLSDVFAGLEEPMIRVGEAWSEYLAGMFDVFKDIADTGVLIAVADGLVAIADGLSRLMSVPGLAKFVGTFVGLTLTFATIGRLGGAVAGAFAAIRTGLGGGAIIGTLAAIGSAISAVAAGFGILITLPAAVTGAIAVALATILYLIVTNWDQIWEYLKGKWEEMKNAFNGYVEDIKGFFEDLGDKWDRFWERFRSGVDKIKTKFGELYDRFRDGLRDIGQWFTDRGQEIRDAIDKVKEWLGTLRVKFYDLWSRFRDGLREIGEWFTGLADTAKEKFGDIVDFFKELPGKILEHKDAIVGAIKDIFDFEVRIPGTNIKFSPMDVFTDIVPGLAHGGIFDKATPAIIGEAGREVVIPLTKPARALELAMASGLFDVLGRASRAPVITSAPREDNSGIDRLIEEIRNLGSGPGGGDTIQLVLPPGAGDTPVSYALATARELRSDRWRRPK